MLYKLEEVGCFGKCNQNVYITCFVLLIAYIRAEKANFIYFIVLFSSSLHEAKAAFSFSNVSISNQK